MLPYTVDLSQYRQLGNAELIAHIDRVGVEMYARYEKAPPVDHNPESARNSGRAV